MIDREHPLPLTRQSRILELSRSSLYYEAVRISDRDLKLMRLIDEIHLKHPFMGSRNIRDQLQDMGHKVGRQHVSTLMRKMGITAMYRKPRLSKPHPDHKVYPYLLRGLKISRANQVWAADITYLPMARGFCYLVAIMDWASRKVLAWRLSNTLDASFCVEALQEALARYGTLRRRTSEPMHAPAARPWCSPVAGRGARLRGPEPDAYKGRRAGWRWLLLDPVCGPRQALRIRRTSCCR